MQMREVERKLKEGLACERPELRDLWVLLTDLVTAHAKLLTSILARGQNRGA